MNAGLPLIISTGLAAGDTCLDGYADETILLHCVARYPSRIEDANLQVINTIRELHGDLVGLSDHTPGYETAIAATALGAVMIEKHFKLDDDCIDAAYSLDPVGFKTMVVAVRAIHKGMGDGQIRPTGQPRQR
jgi:N,N'-diacetyllegionaminate synthase